MKALKKGFLKGCSNMNEELVTKYLSPIPATAKGHMKWPKKGIRSTTPKGPTNEIRNSQLIIPAVNPEVLPLFNEARPYPGPAYNALTSPAMIEEDDDKSIANVFCFSAFANKITGVIYNDLTGNFPFMSLDGSLCIFVMYHYKTNSILATPIANMNNKSIFEAFKAKFNMLEEKGHKPKVNLMDSQATKYIKQFLTKKGCKLQLVEPHNHRVNAAEQAIQTFKDAFIAALATTDVEFPLQLWDKFTPQVQDTLNILRESRVTPGISAYEALNGPYDWGRYPLALIGCKAIIYEAPAVRGSWASQGTDAWYLGPSKDHYRCNLYYVPETRAYRISGSAELFPQHCQVPNLSPNAHLHALTKELATITSSVSKTTTGQNMIKVLQAHLNALIKPVPNPPEQRVIVEDTPPPNKESIQRVSQAPAIMKTRDPRAKCNLILTKRSHGWKTRNNTPGYIPAITRDK